MTADQIEIEALRLPLEQRARLAERLIASLDGDVAIEQMWLDEVRRRDAELESGAAKGIPLEDAVRTIGDRFGWLV